MGLSYLCTGRCLAVPFASTHEKPTGGDSRHTQNIHIDKVIGENEKCVLFYGKNLTDFLAKPICNRLPLNTKYYFICMVLYIFPPAFIPNFSFCSSRISKPGNQDYFHFRNRTIKCSKRLSNLMKFR